MGSPKSDDPEVEWVRQAQRGEREAFERLVERYQRRVFSLVFRLVRRREEVEDVAQEIFVKVFRAIRKYNFQASFGTWLFRITVNHCYDVLRRERASPIRPYGETAVESDRMLENRAHALESSGVQIERQTEARDLVEKLLGRARLEDRTILVLKELEGLSVEEIGSLLKLKESTVKVRLHRARKRMLDDYKRWQGGG